MKAKKVPTKLTDKSVVFDIHLTTGREGDPKIVLACVDEKHADLLLKQVKHCICYDLQAD